MKSINYIGLAIPFFFIMIGVEILVARRQNKKLYRLNDSINDLSTGITQQLLGIFAKAGLAAGYIYLYENQRFFSQDDKNIAVWIACFIGVDFFYYWFHRMGHEINALWAGHIVHHQSEEYNLSVALRQGAFQNWFSWVFYLPLALLGFPPVMFFTLSAFNTLYQFWIHTRTIGKLGPFEWIFNTPSHHRVHHGRNPKYIDKNHAGTLIIWDRMFGTFKEEEEEPQFGITSQLGSWNPLWANFHYWVDLFKTAAKAKGLDKIRVFLKPPGWFPDYMGGRQYPPDVANETRTKYDAGDGSVFSGYILAQFALVGALTTTLILLEKQLPMMHLAAGAIWCIASLVSFGGMFEQKSFTVPLEALRLMFPVAYLGIAFGGSGLSYIAIPVAVLSLAWFITLTRTQLPPTPPTEPLGTL